MKRQALLCVLPGRPAHLGLTLLLLLLCLTAGGQELQLADQAAAPVSTTAGKALEPGELFVNANAAYEAGDHQRAIELYNQLLQRGVMNGAVSYNLGNAYLRNGELGKAIASYRRSQALQPRDEDLLANLSFARRTAKDAVQPPRPAALLATLFFWHYRLSRSELLATVLVVNLLLWASLILRLYRRASEVLRWTFFVLLLLLVATGGSLAVHLVLPTQVAVVVPQEVEVLTGPGDDALVRFKLHSGSEVLVRDQRQGWLRITLPDSQQGWINRSHVEVVRL